MRRSTVPSPPRHAGSRVAWWATWWVASCVVVFVGCSSDDAVPVDDGPVTTAGSESTTTPTGGEGAAPTSAGRTAPQEVYAVSIDVSVGRLELSERLDVSIDPGDHAEIDPFTRFSSCSGSRASIGTFAVTAVDDTAAVRSVSVVTVDRVIGPGIYDADIRVETAEGAVVSAAGTVTLTEDLASGAFEAFEPTGETVSGTFTCDGPSGTPVPLVEAGAAADDGRLRTVEVVALLRRGDEERIVGLALDTGEVEAAEAECPGVTGGDGTTLVSVDGGLSVGAITTFELVGDPSTSMRLDVVGASYEVDDVVIDVDDRGAAGTFSGVTADGITIDGAFRCA